VVPALLRVLSPLLPGVVTGCVACRAAKPGVTGRGNPPCFEDAADW